jgi:hypothetical protein
MAWALVREPELGDAWRAVLAGLLLALGGLWGCSPSAPSASALPSPARASANKERLRALREREGALRSSFTPREQPVWLDVSGSDPYRLVSQASGLGFVGLLRGARALVALSHELGELQRVLVPETPTALCVAANGGAWVASRYGDRLVHVRLGSERAKTTLVERRLPVAGVADVACGDAGVVYVLPADGSDLLTLDGEGRVLGRWPALPGPLRLLKRGRFLLESSLFERSVRVLELDGRGVPVRERARIRHDGTLWAFDARELGTGLVIAVAGVEDKPLVRAHGEFENIDSFLWLYGLDRELSQLAELDVSDQGLVVPKALRLEQSAEGWTVTALAAGSGQLLRATWPSDFHTSPRLETRAVPPGMSDAVFEPDGRVVYADPLFDAWITVDRASTHLTRVDPTRRPEPEVRLGEALFFTELMAPDNTSLGTHSRFSCETCHFEGGVDGRRHYTGRADVSVVTKPLFGLANNRPHFSRAMDPDLSSVSHNEFRVAGAGSGTNPWFTLSTARFSWLHELGISRAELGPLELRAALLRFLYAFSPAPNPNSQGRSQFSALETDGAAAFREHCQSCHAPRLLSDDSESEVPFADWEALVMSRNGPLVWARGDYAKTGIVPYVHERGTRITSLRRLAQKPRYFTNGSAPDLANVLERFRETSHGALHDAGDEHGEALSTGNRQALAAFLRLL